MAWFKHHKTEQRAADAALPPRRPLAMALEPRVMLDGAAVVTAAQFQGAADAPVVPGAHVVAAHDAVAHDPAALLPHEQALQLFHDPGEHDASAPQANAGRDVLFVDARVQDAGELLAHVRPGTEVVYLDQSRDGLAQMRDYLDAHTGVASVQIVAHGNDGDLWLGNTYLSSDTLDQHAAELQQIGAGIQHGGDILIYACDTAAGDRGMAFVTSLADLTQRDVAASSDRTGAGSDWDLEISTGHIEATSVLSAADMAGYTYDLSTITVTTGADSGAGSLRAAITGAISGDTITFATPGLTVNLSSGELVIAKNLTIDGDLNNDGVADVTVDANYTSRVFSITGGNVTLDGLIIENGLLSGNGGGLSGHAGGDALGAGIYVANATLTITHSSIRNNAASGGGGAGTTGSAYSYGGGGGGGMAGTGGGNGGDGHAGYPGTNGGGGIGGNGGNYGGPDINTGKGGGTAGGAGAVQGESTTAYQGWTTGGQGGTAGIGGNTIGGGGGGSGGYNGTVVDGRGGNAVGGMYIASTATVYMTATTVTGNLAAGGGGGGAGGSAGGTSPNSTDGAAGGIGIGGIWNKGTLHYQGSTVDLLGTDNANYGAGGKGGKADGHASTVGYPAWPGGTDGAAGAGGNTGGENLTNGGTVDSSYTPVSPASITSATYDASTGTLVVTGADMGAGDTISVGKLTLTGQNNGSYTLTSADVTASSGTAFTVVLNAADRVGVNGLLNRNGTIAVDATTFNLAGATGWDSTAGAGADLTGNGVTVSNVIAPTITSATYNALTHVLTVTGTNLVGTPGANNDIAVSTLMLRGEGGTSYVLTSSDVEVAGATSFSVTLNATDRAAVEQMLNKDGTSSTGGTTYNLAAADDWNSVIGNTDISDATNAVTVNNVPAPTIANASYDASTGTVVVTGTGFLSLVGASNDIVANKFTFTGDGGATYTLTDTANVDITSGTSFTLVLSANDRMALNLIVNRNGTSSTGFTPYNLAAAEDWAAGADAAVVTGDTTGNGITASNVAVPAITSASYDASTGTVVVTGTGFLSRSGASNDIVANKFTFRGEGGATYTLTDTANVEITSGTSFTLVLSATDKAGVDQLIDKNGTSATGGTPYNLAAADDWAAGADAALAIGDTTGNGITASNVDASAVLTPSGGTTAFVEGNSVAVDGGLSLADPDSTTMASAVVSLTGGFHSGEDALSFSNDGATMGNITATYNTATGVMTLNSAGAASLAQWQAALRAVQYTNTSDDPNTGTRTVSFAINDGTRDSLAVTKSVSVTGVNDAPWLSTNTFAPTFTEGGSAVQLFAGTGIDTMEAGQSIHALTLTVGGVADGASEILVVDGTNVALTNGNLVITGGNGYTATVTLSGGVATVAITKVGDYSTSAAQVLVNGLKYSNSSDKPTVAGGRTVTLVSIQDDGGTANGGVDTYAPNIGETVTLVAVNDAPVVTTDSGSAAFTAGDNTVSTPVAVDAGISVADVDNGTLASATVSITGNFHAGEDVLAFTNDGATMGNIAASYNAATGVLTLSSASGTATLAQWQAALRSVAYTDTAITPDTATRTVSFTVNDGAADSTVATRTVTVVATDQTPIVTTTGGSTNYVGGASAVTIDTGIAVGDLDNTTQSSATVSVTTGFHSGDALGFVNDGATMGNIFASYNAATGVMTLTSAGATAKNAEWASALSSVTFASTSTSYGARTIAFAVNDGVKTSAVATDTVNLLGLPTVTDVGSSTLDGSYKVGDTITLTVDFDQAVVVDGSGGTPTLRLETGSVDREAVYVGGSGSSTLTFSYTVQAGDASADLDYASTAALALNGASIRSGVGVDALLTLPATGGASSIAGQHAIVVDGVAPTVVSVAAPANGTYVAGQGLDFTVNYSEAVTVDTTSGTPRIAITLDTGGTVYADYVSGNGTTALVFHYTVATGQNDADGITLAGAIDLNGGSIRDAVGNAEADALNGVAATTNVRVDAVAPTASIALSDTALKIGDTATVTIHFSEAVSGLTTADFSVANGSLGGLSSSDGGVTWTATFTPASNVTGAGNLIVLDNTGYTDAAGNTGTGSTASPSYTIDTVRPTASIALSDAALGAGETATVTIRFSEAVSGLDAGDFTVENGTLGGLATTDGGLTWTATLTPTAGITDTGNLITLDNAGYTDAVGNAGTGSTVSPNYAIDTTRPTASIVLSDTALKVGDTSAVTITFNKAVSGLDASDFAVENGTLDGLATTDGGLTWTATFTPASNVTDASNLIVLDNTGYTDAAGNTGSGNTTSANYTIDTARPTASITLSDTALKAGETSVVTINFSEAVSGLDASDFTVENGSLSGLSSSDGGVTWTATFTPTADVTDASNLITLDNTGYTDAAGNTGTGNTASMNYAVDTQPPQLLSITRNDAPVNSGEQGVSYTITFSEDVSGLTAADLQLVLGGDARASIGQITAVDGHTYVVRLDPVDGSGSVRLDLAPGGIADLAGNPLPVGGQGEAYTLAGMQPLPPLATGHLPGMSAGAVPWFTPPTETSPLPLATIQFQPAVPAWRAGGLALDRAGGLPSLDTVADTPLDHAIPALVAGPAMLPVDAGATFMLPLGEPGSRAAVVQVTLADGGALPAWLHFDPVTGTLTGEAPAGHGESLELRVVSIDEHGQVQVRTLELRVAAEAPAHAPSVTDVREAAGKPPLHAQFGAVRHAGTLDHAALLRQLAVAQRQAATAVAP